MQKVGRISTTAAGKSTENATHQGVNFGKVEKFRYSLEQADRDTDKGRDRDADTREQGDQDDEREDLMSTGLVIVR